MKRSYRLASILLLAVIAIGFAWNERVERFHQQQAVFDPWSYER